MCCANPKGRTPECARTRTYPQAEGQGPNPQPRSAPHGSPALGIWVLELLLWTGVGAWQGKGKSDQILVPTFPGSAASWQWWGLPGRCVRSLQPCSAQTTAVNKKPRPKHPDSGNRQHRVF